MYWCCRLPSQGPPLCCIRSGTWLELQWRWQGATCPWILSPPPSVPQPGLPCPLHLPRYNSPDEPANVIYKISSSCLGGTSVILINDGFCFVEQQSIVESSMRRLCGHVSFLLLLLAIASHKIYIGRVSSDVPLIDLWLHDQWLLLAM